VLRVADQLAFSRAHVDVPLISHLPLGRRSVRVTLPGTSAANAADQVRVWLVSEPSAWVKTVMKPVTSRLKP
jgi:hypothetical protein